MINCNDPRKNCGTITPSSCVSFTGKQPTFIATADFPCDVNVTDVLDLATAEIDKINTGKDLTGLNKRCLVFDPATIDIKGLSQIQIDELCALDASVSAVQSAISNLAIGTELVSVDLGAMTPMSNPCSATVNQYTLFYVLQAFANELNVIKTNLGI